MTSQDDLGIIDLDREGFYLDDGRRLTNALAHEMSDRAAQGALPPGLKPGGKSLSGDGSHSPAVRVVLPHSVKVEVDARARAAHMSTSKWVRRTIEQALAA